ncbi:MAG TPA: OsmC family protein [Longimicrobiales bacterium]|nr:OsmC family protein [Longimicrobiales bacterium]
MEHDFEVTLTRQDHFRFLADFGDGSGAVLRMDEPEPLGEGSGPNAARVLAAAIGNCLSASLLYCLEKARVEVADVRTTVGGSIVRNERGRFRLGPLEVRIEPEVRGKPPGGVERCLELFEDFCIVTQSARGGLDVEVEVRIPVEQEALAEAAP